MVSPWSLSWCAIESQDCISMRNEKMRAILLISVVILLITIKTNQGKMYKKVKLARWPHYPKTLVSKINEEINQNVSC